MYLHSWDLLEFPPHSTNAFTSLNFHTFGPKHLRYYITKMFWSPYKILYKINQNNYVSLTNMIFEKVILCNINQIVKIKNGIVGLSNRKGPKLSVIFIVIYIERRITFSNINNALSTLEENKRKLRKRIHYFTKRVAS